MVTQEMVEEHARRSAEAVEKFGKDVSAESEVVISGTLEKFLSKVSAISGYIEPTPQNRMVIGELRQYFEQSVDNSGTKATFDAFVAYISSEQVASFRKFYQAMSESARLPALSFSDDDLDIMQDQVVATLATFDSHIARVSHEIGNLSARSLGGSRMDQLTNRLAEGIRKINSVEPIGRDHNILFFRLLGHLAYRSAEAAGYPLRYSYVGPEGDPSRVFCASIGKYGQTYSIGEISTMDNGQLPNPMVTGGGFGCRHWWKVADGAPGPSRKSEEPAARKPQRRTGWGWLWGRP